MANAEIWAIVIGIACGLLASVPVSILLLIVQARLAMQNRQESSVLDIGSYPGQIIIIERPMLKDGEP